MEIIKNVKIVRPTFELKSGKELTIIEIVAKGANRVHIVLRTQNEIKELRDDLNKVIEFWENQDKLDENK